MLEQDSSSTAPKRPDSTRTLRSGEVSEDGPVPQIGLPYASELRQGLAENTKVEVFVAAIVIFSAGLFAVETLPGLSPLTNLLLQDAEDITVVIFALEFFIRWYSVSLAPSFLLQPLAIVDLLSFAPFLVLLFVGDPSTGDGLGGLTLLRLLRVLRLQRFVANLEAYRKFELAIGITTFKSDAARRLELEVARVASSIATLVFVSTGLIYNAEHVANPQIPDYFTAVYFGLTTLTTVGFGDITPVTAEGRLVVSLSILVGAAIIPIQLAQLGEAFLGSNGGLEGRSPASERSVEWGADTGAGPIGDFSQPMGAKLLTCSQCSENVHLQRARYCCRCGAVLPKGVYFDGVESEDNSICGTSVVGIQ